MKKSFLLIFFMLIFSVAHAQFSVKGKGSEKSSRVFFFKKKLSKQMSHFDKKRRDPLLRSNGTSYRRDRKLRYKVDANGFDMPNQGRRNRKKTK